MSPDQLSNAPDAVIIDVRSPDEFAGGHVDGAINIPLDKLANGIDGIPSDALIVTVCGKGGGRSDEAAAQLRSAGFRSARPLCGGTLAWMQRTTQGTAPWPRFSSS
jgi:rhodanese-related sulfurtransferase